MSDRRRFIRPAESEAVDLELEHDLPITDDEIRINFGLRILNDLDSGALELRPLPKVALELSRLAANPDPDVNDAVAMIERDAPIAARVLRVAGSSAFSRRPPRDLNQAAVALGINGLRDLAFAASIGKVFRCGPLESRMRGEMSHAFTVALGTAHVCRVLGIGGQHGFLCGMLHDIGAIVVLMAIAEYSRAQPELMRPEFVDRAVELLHERLGESLTRRWSLDPVFRAAAAYHHDPERAGAAAPMAYAVAVADTAADLDSDDADARAAALCARPLGYRAGLSADQLVQLATVIQDAKGDPLLASMAA